MRKAVLLVNLGSPLSPSKVDVADFLRQFLNDKNVMTIPWLMRYWIVNKIIIPKRLDHVCKLYEQLYTDDQGSPLRYNLYRVQELLSERLQDTADVYAAVTYTEPLIETVLDILKPHNYDQLVVLPMFPNYARSTTASIIERVQKHTAKWKTKVTIIKEFYQNPIFTDTLAEHIRSFHPEAADHILFSFHGLPVVHLTRSCRKYYKTELGRCHCDPSNPCYGAACRYISDTIAKKLKLPEDGYSTVFQSNMGRVHWTQPFLVDELPKLAVKYPKLLVVTPCFVSDCLETVNEIGIEARELFIQAGGKSLQLVPALNTNPLWIKALHEILIPYL